MTQAVGDKAGDKAGGKYDDECDNEEDRVQDKQILGYQGHAVSLVLVSHEKR
jgi:hypothetical protein